MGAWPFKLRGRPRSTCWGTGLPCPPLSWRLFLPATSRARPPHSDGRGKPRAAPDWLRRPPPPPPPGPAPRLSPAPPPALPSPRYYRLPERAPAPHGSTAPRGAPAAAAAPPRPAANPLQPPPRLGPEPSPTDPLAPGAVRAVPVPVPEQGDSAGMLLSKINSLAHLCSAPPGDLHPAKLPPGEPGARPHPLRSGLGAVQPGVGGVHPDRIRGGHANQIRIARWGGGDPDWGLGVTQIGFSRVRGVAPDGLVLTPLVPWPAGKEKEPLEKLYQVGSLLGSGGFGSVYSGTRLSDSAPVSARRLRPPPSAPPACPRPALSDAWLCLGCRWPSSTWLGTASRTGESW